MHCAPSEGQRRSGAYVREHQARGLGWDGPSMTWLMKKRRAAEERALKAAYSCSAQYDRKSAFRENPPPNLTRLVIVFCSSWGVQSFGMSLTHAGIPRSLPDLRDERERPVLSSASGKAQQTLPASWRKQSVSVSSHSTYLHGPNPRAIQGARHRREGAGGRGGDTGGLCRNTTSETRLKSCLNYLN